MATSSRRAVITGIGIINPIGQGREAFWQSLQVGRSGVRRLHAYDVSGLPVQIAGEIPDFDAKKFIDKKQGKNLKVMARTIQLAVSAAQLALDDSGIDKEKLDPTRFGIEFGAGLIATDLEDLGPASKASVNCQPGAVDLEKWGEQGIPSMTPLWMLKYLPNMLACQVSIMHNAQGPNNTITESDVASLLALGESFRILTRGHADFMLVGGADSRLNPLSMVRQCLFLPLSPSNDVPEKACKPFDRRRNGLVLGEGAGVVVMEDFDHARQRGAKILAEVIGFGSAFDRGRTGAGLARAIRAALADAGVGPDQIDHINAQGYGTVPADIWEAKGLVEVFGPNGPPVFAGKSYFGNLGAGSSISEISASLLAMHHGQLPPTLNFEEPDPACPVTVAAGGLRPVTKPCFLKIAFTDVGQCGALVCRKWNDS